MNPLVTAAWLDHRIHHPDLEPHGLAILDATLPPVGVPNPPDTHARYLAQHIPGAVFFDIEALSDRSTNLPHMLPTPEMFSAAMSALGVAIDNTIVIYEQEGVFSAPRAWWMLRTMGAQNVHILDGDLHAWAAAGHPTQSGPPHPAPVHPAPTTFKAKLNPNAIRVFEQIKRGIVEHAQILDARSAGRFTGAAPEPRPGLSSGHMPGAISTPFTELVEDGRMKLPEQLQQVFSAKEIDLTQPIITTLRLRSHRRRHRSRPRDRRRKTGQPLRRLMGRVRPTPRSSHRKKLMAASL